MNKSYFAPIAALAAISVLAAAPVSAREAGVAAAVNADSLTLPPQEQERTLVVGHNIVFNERITTGEEGQAQLLMLDQSAVTVAPNSALVIDKFIYDPDTKTGEMALSLSKGLMRFVGGRLSKSGNATVRTPVATMGIRGGIALINVINPTTVDVTLLYGDAVEGVTNEGETFNVRRSGYFTRLETGKQSTPPKPAGTAVVAATISSLQGRSTATAGAPVPPTDEGAETQIGFAPQPIFDPPATAEDVIEQTVTQDENAPDRTEISNPDAEELEELGGLVELVQLDAFEVSGGREGDRRFKSAAQRVRILKETADSTGSETVLEFGLSRLDNGDQAFVITSEKTGRHLAAEIGKGALLFSENGGGNPNAVPNVFDNNDPTLFVSSPRYNSSVRDQIGNELAAIFAAQNVHGGKFFNVDLSSPDFNGVVGSRLTVFGGEPLRGNVTGVKAFKPAQDSQTLSVLPFSDVGLFRLPNGAGFGGTRVIKSENVEQSDILVNFDKGKVLYQGAVIQNLVGETPTAGTTGETVYGFQAFVGTLDKTADGFAFVGKNAGSTHFERGNQEARLFHVGANVTALLGDLQGGIAATIDGGHDTIQHQNANGVRQNPIPTANHQFSLETPFSIDPNVGAGQVTEVLFAGGMAANSTGEIEVLATREGDEFDTGPGELRINRDTMEASMRFLVSADVTGDEIEIVTNFKNSAFFGDDHFAVIRDQGFLSGAGEGFVAIGNGETTLLSQPACACEFMHWGFWAAAANDIGSEGNAVSDVGGFFSGTPTPDIDMPISGTGIFRGNAIASMAVDDSSPSFANGAFELQVNFGNGVSAGTMNLADQNFDILGNHSPGNSSLTVDYIQNAQFVGDGTGRFFGPQANNVGVTIDIDGNGIKAGGIAVGQQE